MKVKSFSIGLADGVDQGMETLDKLVAKLGDIDIRSVTDTVYSEELSRWSPGPKGPLIVRVVVYGK